MLIMQAMCIALQKHFIYNLIYILQRMIYTFLFRLCEALRFYAIPIMRLLLQRPVLPVVCKYI